jgi:3-hydroxybutyrate dehydrogenase
MSAFITGASRGIGLAIADRFAAQGADLCLVATSLANLAEAEHVVAAHGRRAELLAMDVADRSACFDAIEFAREKLGKVDILVNNAGFHKISPFVDHTPEDFDRTLKVDLYGPFHLMQAVLPPMLARGYGKIVNVASLAGKWASPSQCAYNAAKHGLVGLTRCLALETAALGISVNAICPGLVDTDMVDRLCEQRAELEGTTADEFRATLLTRIPAGRLLATREVADLALYLASHESDGMTGQSISLDGGMLFT